MTEETEKRIKSGSLDYLRSWKNHMEGYKDTKEFNQEQYEKIVKEIKYREENPTEIELITKELVDFCNGLLDRYNKANVDQVISCLPDAVRLQQATSRSKR